MAIKKPLPEEMNGFKVVRDIGAYEKGGIRYAIVVCKACGNEFETSTYHVKKISSCGCLPARLAKELPNEINGFRILKDFGYLNGSRRALIVCKVCKREYEADPNKLVYRLHCGCMKKGAIASRYNKEYPRLGNTYKKMIARCYRKTDQDYYNYGARGIMVCDEWKKDRNKFVEWALKNGYSDDLSIDRIDSSKGYSPENCRWENAIGQARNTRRNVLTMELANKIRKEYRQEKKPTHYELAMKYDVSEATIWLVVNNRIWKE